MRESVFGSINYRLDELNRNHSVEGFLFIKCRQSDTFSLFENVADLIFTVNLAGLKELKKFVAFQLLNRIKLVFKVVLITVCKNLCLNTNVFHNESCPV